MNRKEFLSGLGIAGIGSLIPSQLVRRSKEFSAPPGCTLIPSETAGPFPLDLSENTAFFRQDLREDREGVQLNVKIRITGVDNCEPMQNARVNIWHCDKDGLYSGYDQNNNQGQAGLSYLRGYQFTDSNGEVEFTTILPGWYTGRICHIHFQVYVSSSYSAISQLTFDIDTKNAIYEEYSDLYTKGADPLEYDNDNIFSDGYAYQLATLAPNEDGNGYDSYLEVSVQGAGVVGIGHQEKEAAKYFALGQNFPNPYKSKTTIPYELMKRGDINLSLWNLNGQKVYDISRKNQSAGAYQFEISPVDLGLAVGNYVYQLQVSNSKGRFTLSKMMTAIL